MSSPGQSSQTLPLQADLTRIAALAWGVLCWKWATRLWETGDMKLESAGLWLGMFGPLLGLAFLVCAIGPLTTRRASLLSLVGATYALLSFMVIEQRTHLEHGLFFSTDAHIFMDYAARLLRQGENPYDASLLDAFRAFRTPVMQQTPLIDGDLTGRVAYPALSFLLLVPFEACGIATRYVYALFMIAGLLIAFTRVRPSVRPLALLPFFLDDSYLNYSFGGVTDSVWAVLLMGVVVTWNYSPFWRAILLGLACSYKQQPWLVAPLLALRVALETEGPFELRARRVAQLCLGALIPFAIINAPFFMWNPESFLNGVLEPWRAQMVMFGQGLSGLTMMGRVVIEKRAYTAFFFGAYLVCSWIYVRHFERMRELVWIIPPIAFWFAPRSLSTYWYLNALPFAMALLDRGARPYVPRAAPAHKLRSTVLFASGFAAAVLATTLFFTFRPAPFAISAPGPHTVSWESIQRLHVVVENFQETPLRPQFYVLNHVHQPVLWPVAKGPDSVAPGARESFEIEAPWPAAQPMTTRGALITVAQHGSYDQRASTFLPASPDSRYPDAIPNGSFRFWTAEARNPGFWKLMTENAPGAKARLVGENSSETWSEVELSHPKSNTDKPRTLELDTYVLLPEHPLEVNVFVPASANRLPAGDMRYGLRVFVRGALHAILFGDHEGPGEFADGTRFYGVKAERNRWSRHVLDLRKILTALDADLRPQRVRMPRFDMLDMPMVPVGVRLFASTTHQSALKVRFGPLRTRGLAPDIDRMVAQNLARPEDAALWHAQFRITQGLGPETFEEVLEQAVRDPSPSNQFVAGEVAFQEGRYQVALSAYSAAQRVGYDRLLANIGIGRSLLRLRHHEAALEAFERVVAEIDANPSQKPPVRLAEAYEGIALAQAELGECKQAMAALAKVQQLVVKSAPPNSLRLLACTSRDELDGLHSDRLPTATAPAP